MEVVLPPPTISWEWTRAMPEQRICLTQTVFGPAEFAGFLAIRNLPECVRVVAVNRHGHKVATVTGRSSAVAIDVARTILEDAILTAWASR